MAGRFDNMEKEIAKRYGRIIGRDPIGLTDTLRILSSEDMIELTLDYFLEKDAEYM